MTNNRSGRSPNAIKARRKPSTPKPRVAAPPSDERINDDLRALACAIEDLHEDADNVRVHSDRNIKTIEASLRRFGQQRPLVALEDGTVIAGNGTLAAARRLGWQRIAVVRFPDLEAARAYAIADNRSGELASWSAEGLVASLGELEVAGWSVTELGFSEAERRRLEKEAQTTEDDVPPIPKKPVAKVGDLWILGEHRVVCGDATDATVMERLMDGARAAVVHTDPPYGEDIVARGLSVRGGKHDAIINDGLRRDQLAALVAGALKRAVEHTEAAAAFYVWHASSTTADFAFALTQAGLRIIQTIFWVKPAAPISWAHYQWAHEPCFYAAKGEVESPSWYGGQLESTAWYLAAVGSGALAASIGQGILLSDGNGSEIFVAPRPPASKKKPRHIRVAEGERVHLEQASETTTVWEVGRDAAHPEHPTQKPVEVARRAIVNSSRPGEIVLDSFLGSGTTLIAAERTGRRCYGTELDPHYVDVIVARWEALTGQKAARA